jgi:hypothetical protein
MAQRLAVLKKPLPDISGLAGLATLLREVAGPRGNQIVNDPT